MATNILVKFDNEDHTLGVLLRNELVNHPKTVFAGYKTPHPLFTQVELRLETVDVAAEEVLTGVIEKYRERVQSILKSFQ